MCATHPGNINPTHDHLLMALSATIFKATLHIADMERNYYQDHALTLARHPSETDERLMVRLLVSRQKKV